MIDSIVRIIIGLMIWKIVPGWIEFGTSKARSFVQLCCDVVGIIILISGVISLIKFLL